jgi:hypothetical protein
LLEPTLRASCPTVKSPTHNTTSGETPIKTTQTCFPPIHQYTRTSARRSVDLPSCGSVKKFTSVSFFTEISACLKISKSTSLTKSCMYLKPKNSLQWTACST